VMGDTQAAYQNVVLVFSAAVEDATADGVVSGAVLDAAYLVPAMNAMNDGFGPIIKCSHTTTSFVGGTASIDITCESVIGNSIDTKFSSTFTKTVSFS